MENTRAKINWDDKEYLLIAKHLLGERVSPKKRGFINHVVSAQKAVLPPEKWRKQPSLSSKPTISKIKNLMDLISSSTTITDTGQPSPAPISQETVMAQTAQIVQTEVPGDAMDTIADADAMAMNDRESEETNAHQCDQTHEDDAPREIQMPSAKEIDVMNAIREIANRVGILLAENIISASIDYLQQNMDKKVFASLKGRASHETITMPNIKKRFIKPVYRSQNQQNQPDRLQNSKTDQPDLELKKKLEDMFTI